MARDGDWWIEGLPDTQGTMLPQVFPVVIVSEHVHGMIRELEMAAGACAACPKCDMSSAYQHLNVTRSTLYRYIQSIERQAKVTGRTHIKRF
jgi:hypothetical protein